MRGKPGDLGAVGVPVRIIPARAGQTGDTASQRQSSTDHPRACGANVGQEFGEQQQAGSSPRVRGKLVGRAHSVVIRRIIPARAGQTSCCARCVRPSPDHPRACGANVIVFGVVHNHLGSSPRVRGKLILLALPASPIRIIPARAGQTARATAHGQEAPDHPRACGANQSILYRRGVNVGSSPRVRGKLAGVPRAGRRRRIIPARAGQTSWFRSRLR